MRQLREIAQEISSDWPEVKNSGARHALEHMKKMGAITDPFYEDQSGHAVVGSFLEHARGWYGPVARRVKKELREMVGHPRP